MRPVLIAVTVLSTVLAPAHARPAWSVQQTPGLDRVENLLYSVSCASATACTAVGGAIGGHKQVPVNLAEAWNGKSWSLQHAPEPPGSAYSILQGVSCTSPTACTAVGGDSAGTVAESWNGTRWSVQATPTQTVAFSSQLDGVSCLSADACTAVGWYYRLVGNGLKAFSLAEAWNGTAWSVQPTPNPAGSAGTFLVGVSCTSAAACTAVGRSDKGKNGDTLTLAEAWNGKRWSIQPTPGPAGAASSALAHVSCTAATACTAVGQTSASSTDHTLAEAWDGTSWSVQATPAIGGAAAYLTDVSCTAATACTAVGGRGSTDTLAEGWNGTRWSVQATPDPLTAGETFFQGVSCTSATVCTAAGYYDSTGRVLTLAERHSG